MPRFTMSLALVVSALTLVSAGLAQQSSVAAVPNLIRYGGFLKDAQGATLSSSTVGVTFAIYKQQDGDAPIWMETQSVTTDASGNYTALLGSTTATGLPGDLFSQQEQRWLGVQAQGQAEQPRVLLVSVPYAFKAHDAETLGGMPASAFVKSTPSTLADATVPNSEKSGSPTPPPGPILGGDGTTNYIPIWATPSYLLSSVIYQASGGKIGVGTTAPTATLDVNGTAVVRSNQSISGALSVGGAVSGGPATFTGVGSFIASTGSAQLIVNNGGSGTTSTGLIAGNSSTISGSGGLFLAGSNAVSVGNNTGLIFVGPNSGQWEQGPSSTGGSHNFMSIALNSTATAAQQISFNTPTGVPIVTGRYGGSFTNTLDDGNNNMTALGWIWQKGRNYLQSNPPNPAGTSSTSFTMMGLGSTLKLTPDFSGTVIIKIDSEAKNTVGDGNGILFEIFYGTGTAPSNGSPATGTQVGPTFERDFWATPGGYATVGFGTNLRITGLTVGTAYWFDIALKSLGSGSSNATIQNIEFYIEEI